jgi:Putative transposase DNA-binding domain
MILVYRYAAAGPHVNRDLVESQMYAAHKHRNALVEDECARRAEVRELELSMGNMPEVKRALALAKEQTELAIAAITRHRSKTRKRDEPNDLKEAIKAARATEQEAYIAFNTMRATLRSLCKPCHTAKLADPCVHATPLAIKYRNAVDEINERTLERTRVARGKSGCHWGTYSIVERAAKQSFGALKLYDKTGAPLDPSFERWSGEGEVGVQIQNRRLDVVKATSGTDRQIRLTLPDERAWQRLPGIRTHRDCEQMARLGEISLRISSTEDDKPIWTTCRLDMHRPLPVGASINAATIHRRMVGPHARWHLTLTVDAPTIQRNRPEGVAPKVVAVDVGWRICGDELRVAGWQDSDGQRGELRLSAADIAMLHKPEAMRGERDKRFDKIIATLGAWRKDNQDMLPDWLREATATMHAWKSEARMVKLWSRWYHERFDGDETAYDALSSWQARARHEWAVESITRNQARRRRKEKYRIFAAQLARTYETIVVEKFDKNKVAAKPPVEAETAENKTARSNRVIVATSELIDCIETAARGRQAVVAAMPCANTTRECPVCGRIDDRGAADSIRLTCECGAEWDQDVDGATTILLERWRKRPGDAKIAGAARKDKSDSTFEEVQETKHQRMKRQRANKVARMQAAREACANGAE